MKILTLILTTICVVAHSSLQQSAPKTEPAQSYDECVTQQQDDQKEKALSINRILKLRREKEVLAKQVTIYEKMIA